MFTTDGSHGGGLNEHISCCKAKNSKKLAANVLYLLACDINDPASGDMFVESYANMLKLKFVVADIPTMTSGAWLKDNMPAIMASLALMPDPCKASERFVLPYIVVQARELCECLVELSVLRMCEAMLESPVA